MLTLWLALASAAEPGTPVPEEPTVLASPSVDDLDALEGWRGRAWGSAPHPDMRRVGPNGPHRVQYALDGEPVEVGPALTAALRWEYDDDRLCTVIAVVTNPTDADLMLRWLVSSYGEPTSSEATSRTWRGERVRLVWREQSAELWVATWSWLALERTAGVTPGP